MVGKQDTVGGMKVLTLNTGWYYTWGPEQITNSPAGIPFIPMIWSITVYTPTDLSKYINSLTLPVGTTPGVNDVLLGYNEPDGNNAGAQANMSIAQAVQNWSLLSSTNRRLGSPVMYGSLTNVSSDPPGTGVNINNVPQPSGISLTNGVVQINISNTSTPNIVMLNPLIWLDNFLIQLAQTTNPHFPDFITVHWYGPPSSNSFLNYLDAINNKYHLPIWVTEYSVADWNTTFSSVSNQNTHTPNIDWSYPTTQNLNTNATALFMSETIAGMNARPFVERFSWKERFLLAYPGPTAAAPQYPIPPGVTPDSIMSSSNPDVMNQSTLYQSYIRFPSTLPPPTPPNTIATMMTTKNNNEL